MLCCTRTRPANADVAQSPPPPHTHERAPCTLTIWVYVKCCHHLSCCCCWICRWQINLVQHWQQHQVLLKCKVEVGYGLSLHPLAGINQQQGTLASSQAAGHLQIGSGTAAAAATAQQQQQQRHSSSSSSSTPTCQYSLTHQDMAVSVACELRSCFKRE
jgi:hypothetical protein